MKVLQVSKFYPPHHGGIEAVAHDLTAGLVARGVEVEVLCANKHARHDHGVDAHGAKVSRVASAGMLLSTSMAPGLLGQLRQLRHRADIVHVHMPDPLAALAVWYARPQGRLVLHWHSDVVRQRWSMHLYRPLQSWLLRRADAVIATSEAYAQSSEPLRSHQHKVKVVPLGAPPPHPAAERLVEEARRRHGGRRIIFSLGRMAYYKGFEVLIDASRQLPDDAIVVIGGGGPDLAHYRKLVEQRGAAGRVQFMGPMSAQRVEAYFAAADIFCMASTLRAEAYGLAVLEAMARGLPVVTTRIPGSGLGWLNRDGDTGLAVDPGDSEALAAALKRLLADEALRQRMGQAARQRWADGLTAMTMSDRILDIYSGLLAAPTPVADLGRHP